MTTQSGTRRVRLFVLISGALVFASLAPLLVSDAALIRRNRDALETLEKKYLIRSSSALADRISAYYTGLERQLETAGEAIRLLRELTGREPFTAEETPRILSTVLRGQPDLLAVRSLNLEGIGSFAGPAIESERLEFEFRRGFETARDGLRYAGKPFEIPQFGPVAVLAAPVVEQEAGRLGVVEALVSWRPILAQFQGEVSRDVRPTLVDREGSVLFPLTRRDSSRRHSSTLVADFRSFPAAVTRLEQTSRGLVIASIAPVRQPDWGVLLERDRDLAFASVDRMVRDTLVWSAAALAGGLLLGLLFARRLTRPIAQLAESARAISEGQYGATVAVAGTSEIAELSESFNRMSVSIKDAFEEVRRAARENRELFVSSIRALAEAIDAKDPYTRGHSERVAGYASTIAEEMGLHPDEIEKIRISALLHDVGKIGIDDRIIRKPTALTEEEFEVMKTHPIKGASIMSAIPQLADVIPGMKYHHEKFEGGGYPEGLKGEQIPLLARVVTVADTFDAMTTTRPYQQAMEIDYVVQRIRQLSPSRYDPVVVSAFVRAYNKGTLVLAEPPSEPAEEPDLRFEAV